MKREGTDLGPEQPAPGNDFGDGVDITLIRWMLSLTPQQRLAVLTSNVRSILRLRDAASGGFRAGDAGPKA